ncbi:hypothetical protein Tco_1221939, partial [Tanacetum coccineum]
SNDSDGELGAVTDHSVNNDQIPTPSIEQVTIATPKTQPQVSKPKQTVVPSCAHHVKPPRQPLSTPKTPSPIHTNSNLVFVLVFILDQDIPSQTDQGNTFVTLEKSKVSREAQAEQISPSTLEAAQILTNVASEGFKGSQAPPGSKIYKRKPKSTTTPTKVLDFEEPAESQVNTGSAPSAQDNTAQVNTGSTPSVQVNTAELNTGETERVQRREGKEPMTEEDLQAEVQASKKSTELQELAGLEAAQRLQATMDAETQRQINL